MAKVALRTPRGRFMFPKLRTPDTKFKKEGEYSVKLVLSEADVRKVEAEVNKVLQPFLDDLRKKASALPPVKAKKELARIEEKLKPVSKPEEDRETGEETGFHVITFSTSASGVSKKTGKAWTRKIPVFDAKGKPMPEKVEPWSGSVGIVAYSLGEPYDTAAAGIGVKCYLEAVQVLELKTANGGGNASAYGFSEEEGYEYSSASEEEVEDEEDGDYSQAGGSAADDSDGDY